MTDVALSPDAEIDVRGLPCANRRAMIFGTFNVLADGQSLVVVNDHEPVGLRGHFEDLASGHYRWEPLQNGPDVFRVRITRCAFDADLARAGAEGLAAMTRHSCAH